MSRVAERDIVRARLAAFATSVSLPIAWDAFNGERYEPVIGTPYLRARIEDGDADYVAIGGSTRKARNVATLLIEVYRNAGEGDDAGNGVADSALAYFKDYQSSGVSFMWRGRVRDVGTDAGWHKWIVVLPYYYEETV